MSYQTIRNAWFGFVTIYACDRQTADLRADRIMTPKTALA